MSLPFQPFCVNGAWIGARWVRGSVLPPALPLTNGPQPWSTFSKSSARTTPVAASWPTSAAVTLAVLTTRTSSTRTAVVPAPAEIVRTGLSPSFFTSTSTLTRWVKVRFFWSPATVLNRLEELIVLVTAAEPGTVALSVVSRLPRGNFSVLARVGSISIQALTE